MIPFFLAASRHEALNAASSGRVSADCPNGRSERIYNTMVASGFCARRLSTMYSAHFPEYQGALLKRVTASFSEKPNINKSGLRLNTESLKFSVAQKEPIPDFEQL